jgi:hypothetical protein
MRHGRDTRTGARPHEGRPGSLDELIHTTGRCAIEIAVDEELTAALGARPYERGDDRGGFLDLTRLRGHCSLLGEEGVHDAEDRPPYPPELRTRLVELARTGRTPEELGRHFEPSAQRIRNWLRQADRDDGRRQDG